MVSLGNRECERSRERVWLERYTEARWERAFAKLDLRCFRYSEKSKEIGRHSYQRQVLQRKLLVLVHSGPLKDRPGAKVLSPRKTWEGHCSHFCVVSEQKYTPALR